MLKTVYNSYGVMTLIVLGITLRFIIFYVSPPSNSYDNHLEVIHTYSVDTERPLPCSCWECYQPPVYYSISAFAFSSSKYFGFSKDTCWKLVQFINPILSILMILLVLNIFELFEVKQALKLLYLSFIIVLPRDIFTSVMIGNDYLLVFLSIAALYFYFRYLLLGTRIKDFLVMSVFVVLGGLTKQHGLLLLFLPGILFVCELNKSKRSYKVISIFFSVFILLVLEETWKFYHTGVFMVSNQHYFDYAVNQFPGKLSEVDFFSFKFISLLKEPFISNVTAASFPTEIYARVFFDYEYRFFNPKFDFANNLGRVGYVLGVIWSLFFVITAWFKFKSKKITEASILVRYVPIILGILFVLVPIIQTIRYPYFSSMKAMFLLPGLIILIMTHAIFIKDIRINSSILSALTVINIVYGIILVVALSLYVEVSLDHLHGPLWPIP